MKQYLDLMQHVMETGAQKHDRTGTGTLKRIWLPDAF
jgi:thymidylate synthase